MQATKNIASIITWLSGAIITLLVIIFPLVYFVVSYEYMVGSLETEGQIGSSQIMKIISTNPYDWEFELHRLQEALSDYPRKGHAERWRTLNTNNEVIAENMAELDTPVIKRSFQLYDTGVVVGRLEIYRSVRPLLMKTVLVALIMLPVGAGAFLILRFLPIRTIYKAEEALRKSKQLLEKTFASLRDAVLILDAGTGKIIDCNQATTALFGYTRNEMLNRTPGFMHLTEEEFREFNRHLDSAVKDKGFMFLPEFSMKQKDGTTFPAEHTMLSLEDDHQNRIGWVHVIQDIRERKMMEEELLKSQKLESLGVLAGGIAHDFNNLLTAILGNISLIKLYLHSPEEVLQIIEDAEKATLRARDLTHQLLTFSQGGTPVIKTTSIVQITKESAGFALRGSNVKCEFSVPDDLWQVDVDEGQISQVVNNLIINADHAMPEGGIIHIRFSNVVIAENDILPLKQGKYVKISFQDHGIGIPKEYLHKIFDPYFTTKQKGSGLGLATAYSILKKHHGHIAVESVQGEGSLFHIYLPASGEHLTPEPLKEETSRYGKGRILLMDDEDAVRKAACLMLKGIGYEVVAAREGRETIALFRKALESGQPFVAVILDITIPGGMGGKETNRQLIEIDRNVKTIVSSGYSNDPIMSEYKDHGFSGVLAKPYRVEELSETVARMIETAQEHT